MAKQRDELTPTSVVELRVHGVSNTPPDNLLGEPGAPLVQTAGEADTAIFRKTDDDISGDHLIRAYSWGKLTSGASRAAKDLQRALWMVLLPFAFANVALWAQPDPPGEHTLEVSRTDGALALLVRLFALTLTATLTLAAVGVTVDQIGWQWSAAACTTCGATASTYSVADVGWLDFLQSGTWSQGTRPLAVGAVMALGVILVIGGVARRSFQYEAEVSQIDAPHDQRVMALETTEHHPMSSPWFWRGSRQVSNLSRLHFSVACATITLAALLPAVARDGMNFSNGWLWPAAAVCGLAIAEVFSSVALLWDAGVQQRSNAGAAWYPALALASVITSLAAIALLALQDEPMQRTGSLPGYGDALLALTAVQWVMILVVAAAAYKQRRAVLVQSPDIAWHGLGPALYLTAGWLLGLLYSAVMLFYVADFLNGSGKPFGADASIELPLALKAASACVVPFLVLFIVMSVTYFVKLRRQARPWQDAVLAEYERPGDPSSVTSPHRIERALHVARARAYHDFFGEKLLDVLGAIALIAFAFSTVAVWATVAESVHPTFGDGVNFGITWWPGFVSGNFGLGARILLLLALVLAGLAALVYRGGIARTVLGIVWDVATFWPRGGHPWAPPCYAERCVPQLVTYIAHREIGPGFILAGHSQGSVIVAATLWQLPPAHRERCAMLSFGTQLRAFYGRGFPGYFGPDQLQMLAKNLTDCSEAEGPVLRWRSFWRRTDPIGYTINQAVTCREGGTMVHVDHDGTGAVAPLRDPDDLSPVTDDYTDPLIHGHSDYWLDPSFTAEANSLAAQLRA